MYAKSNYLQNKLQDFLLRGQVFSPAVTLYVGLLTCTNGIAARSTAYALNNTVAVSAVDGTYHLYKVTTAGTTAASAPAYPGVVGEAITDGTAVLTEQTLALKAGTAIVEPSGGAYARVSVASSLANWSGTQGAATTVASSGTGGQISNNVQLNFPTTTAAWATAPALAWGFFTADASTAGNVYDIGSLTMPNAIGSGVQPYIAVGQLSMTEL
jgi:hypothetical protein